MAEVTIPKEKLDYTIDLLIAMVTEEIAEETGKDRKEVLTDFLCSKTGKALYDEKTKLWCNGPAYITELYREELKKKKVRHPHNMVINTVVRSVNFHWSDIFFMLCYFPLSYSPHRFCSRLDHIRVLLSVFFSKKTYALGWNR